MDALLLQASASAIPLKDETVQCVVTSPPYWGLRAYSGEQRLVWGGEPGHEHEWAETFGGEGYAAGQKRKWQHAGGRAGLEPEAFEKGVSQGGFCACGAWYGALGLEPTPDCGRPFAELRDDLTPKQRDYVLKRLREEGLIS